MKREGYPPALCREPDCASSTLGNIILPSLNEMLAATFGVSVVALFLRARSGIMIGSPDGYSWHVASPLESVRPHGSPASLLSASRSAGCRFLIPPGHRGIIAEYSGHRASVVAALYVLLRRRAIGRSDPASVRRTVTSIGLFALSLLCVRRGALGWRSRITVSECGRRLCDRIGLLIA